MSDSKVPDNQAGYEKGINITLAAQSGANLVYESAGMLASLHSCSLEALVIDNDMMGSINRSVRGIEVNADTLSRDVIADTIGGPGHFLGSEQTLSMMNTEYIYPVIGDRLPPDDWADAGAKDARQAAHDHVARTLADHHPDHIGPALDAELRQRFPVTLDRSG